MPIEWRLQIGQSIRHRTATRLQNPWPLRNPDPELVLATKQERLTLVKLLRAAIPGMTRRERHILRRRFLGENAQAETRSAEELGLSKERVRQLEIRALDKLRAIAAVAQPAE